MSSPPCDHAAGPLVAARVAGCIECHCRERVLAAGAGAAGGDPRSVAAAAGAGLPQAVRGHPERLLDRYEASALAIALSSHRRQPKGTDEGLAAHLVTVVGARHGDDVAAEGQGGVGET